MPLSTCAQFGFLGNRLIDSEYVDALGDVSTTSTTFVDLTGVSMLFQTQLGTVCICTFSASGSNSSINTNVRFQLMVDGVAQRGTKFRNPTTNGSCATLIYRVTGLTAGNHTFKMQWSVSAGTGRIRALTVVEEHAGLLVEEVTV